MAQYRQSGADRLAGRNNHDPHAADQIIIRVPHKHHHRIRRPGKFPRRLSVGAVAVTLSLAILVTLFAVRHLSRHQELRSRSDEDDVKNESSEEFRSSWNQSLPYKELKFGHGSGSIGRDSRYWDRDDRRRDRDYDEEDVLHRGDGRKGEHPENEELTRHELGEKTESKSGGELYNEGGRAELDSYKEEYESSLKNEGQWDGDEEANAIDEYDDGIDVQDDQDEVEHDEGANSDDGGISSGTRDDGNRKLGAADPGVIEKDASFKAHEKGSSEHSTTDSGAKMDHARVVGETVKLPNSERKPGSKRKPKHHKSSSASCEMKLLNSAPQLAEPVENKKFSRFALQYTDLEDRPIISEKWEPRFAGHQTLREREESFYARDQRINCGFIKGPKGSASTGFDLAEDDLKFMSSCHIAVSSCIFGNSDRLRSPFKKMITRQSRKNVCFIMFVDEITLETLSSEGQKMDTMGFIGLWKIVVVKNLPFTDMRRVGKIPKFLAHRLFSSARYSIWLDSKLRLQTDPYLILEYFLWRRGYEYAISNHYDRHCVWEEVVQNKKLNKFNHTVIDQQFEFYRSDGLKRFDPSDPNKLLPSYVPEGSFIVRAHTPMSNLFSCLWFNEVDRFTPRDQLSFAYTYMKLRRMNPAKPFYLNMFKDCERRSIAKLFHHRAEEMRNIPTQID